MKTLNRARLKEFARHLEKIHFHKEHGLLKTINIIMVDEKVRIPIEVKVQHWVLDQLVEVFPEEWGWSSRTGDPILEVHEPDGETIESVFEFFDIEDYEIFCHLFCVSGDQQQPEKWGGKVLTVDSMGLDFAFNIYKLLNRIQP